MEEMQWRFRRDAISRLHARRVGGVLRLGAQLAHAQRLERDVSARVVGGGDVQQAVLRAIAVEGRDHGVREALGAGHLGAEGVAGDGRLLVKVRARVWG